MNRPPDLRLAVPAGLGWLAAVVALELPPGSALLAAGGIAVLGCLAAIGRRGLASAALAAATGCTLSAALHRTAAAPAVFPGAGGRPVMATVSVSVTDDPQAVRSQLSGGGPGRELVRFSGRLVEIRTATERVRLRAPVLVLAPADRYGDLVPDQQVAMLARLTPPDRVTDLIAAVVVARGPPLRVRAPSPAFRVAAAVRSGLRLAVDGLPAAPAGLLPGLVLGDTSRLPTELADAFRSTGLSHLVAVSGANLAILLAATIGVLRRLGVRRVVLAVLGAGVLVGFVLVARPSPSVLRASAMGLVVLVGLASGRVGAPVPALSAAVLGLVLLDPGLARSAGFALSVAATAGILMIGPPIADRLRRRLPGPVAEPVAVSLGASLACLPLLAGWFGRVSLVAVPANLLAAPAVPAATLLGVFAAVCAPVALPMARLVAWVAAVPTGWLILVARVGSDLPGSQLSWATGPVGVALGVASVALVLLAIFRRRPRRILAVGLVAALLAGLSITRVSVGWPPPGWALVACDVGQGDALVLAAGQGVGVVVDAGPEPRLVDSCLRDLGVREVPIVVLTHLHADHVEGLPGVVHGRRVGEIDIGPLDEPPYEWRRVRGWAWAAGIPVRRAVEGETRQIGAVGWTVLAPRHSFHGTNSDPNNSSLVLRVSWGRVTALLAGDIEPPAQEELVGSGVPLRADILKVPHHGSAYQTPELLRAVGERVAITSVGADNSYGHPAPRTLREIRSDGAHGFRTDQDGAVAVIPSATTVRAVGRRGAGTRPSRVALDGRDPVSAPVRGVPGTGTGAVIRTRPPGGRHPPDVHRGPSPSTLVAGDPFRVLPTPPPSARVPPSSARGPPSSARGPPRRVRPVVPCWPHAPGRHDSAGPASGPRPGPGPVHGGRGR